MSLTACRVEIGRPGGSPSPSPSASPVVVSASAEASPSSTASSSAAASASPTASASPSADSTTIEVVTANADALGTATSEAASQAKRLSAAISRVVAAPETAATELPEAEASLAASRAAYLQAEASIFYADPESKSELSALPDPLGSGSSEGENNSFADLAARIDALAESAGGNLDASGIAAAKAALADISSRSQELQTEMESLAQAWGDTPGSFRERYFLASPGGAVARIFQGLLALSGDVLPGRSLAEGKTVSADDVTARVDALSDLYSGGDGLGLDDLVSASSPEQAAAVTSALARAKALSDALRTAPSNADTRAQLLNALDEVTRGLTASAGALGIQIVDTAAQ